VSDSVRILGISGSLRAGSFNTALLRAAQGMLPAGAQMTIFDLRPIPLFDADVERLAVPAPVEALRAAIAAANLLLIATPEYNYSISGVLKNAIDWASRPPQSPLDEKPVAIMGAGGRFGTVRAQLHLRQIGLHNSWRTMVDPELHVQRPRTKFDASGQLTDADTRDELLRFMDAVVAWARQWQPARAAAVG